jgi:hypothetical protein
MQYPVMEWRSIGSLAQVESKGTFGSRAGLVARPAGCIRPRSEAWTAYWGWVSGCKFFKEAREPAHETPCRARSRYPRSSSMRKPEEDDTGFFRAWTRARQRRCDEVPLVAPQQPVLFASKLHHRCTRREEGRRGGQPSKRTRTTWVGGG